MYLYFHKTWIEIFVFYRKSCIEVDCIQFAIQLVSTCMCLHASLYENYEQMEAILFHATFGSQISQSNQT
jgi:hypothetical protein